MNTILNVVGAFIALFLVSKTDTKLGKLSGNVLNVANSVVDAANNCIESINLTIKEETKTSKK